MKTLKEYSKGQYIIRIIDMEAAYDKYAANLIDANGERVGTAYGETEEEATSKLESNLSEYGLTLAEIMGMAQDDGVTPEVAHEAASMSLPTIVEVEHFIPETGKTEIERVHIFEDSETEDEMIEVASYSFDDNDGEEIGYTVYCEGNTYTVDAEWSDGPAWIGTTEPTEADVEAIHTDYLKTMADYEALDRARDAVLDQVMTVAEVALTYGLTRDAVNKAINGKDREHIPARQSGTTWLIRRADAEARWGKRKR